MSITDETIKDNLSHNDSLKSESSVRKNDLEKVIQETAADYSSYIQVDSSEEIKRFDDEIDGLMNKLDDFVNLIELIREDSTCCYGQILPLVETQLESLDPVFNSIDKLEILIDTIKKQMNTLEGQVSTAESHFGTFSGIKKSFLGRLFGKKQLNEEIPKYVRPEIFKTEDFFQ
ncbi:DgyrCDS10139 [Dimorphilus gyrociliatus]|uniref:DgyrCDS10139 n=1 Tax=Dimorphilus gyrociliatus TaxID=2664684 RepID=A0A7I8W0F8_9ANNE|nr:DgyrCDS10139 [Dimorphilus gyrociliatus]